MSQGTFSVLAVCSDKICRSRLAAQLLRARFEAAGVPAVVRSAGTSAVDGSDMTPQAAALSVEYGGTGTGHVARQLTSELVADADLVLTATREHRHAVVALHPRAARYAYSLTQFARLIGAVDLDTLGALESDGLSALLSEVAANRGYVPPPARPALDDIIDPYQKRQKIYDEAGRAIDAAVTTIVDGIVSAGAQRGRA